MTIKELRLQSGMSRSEFAEYFGIRYRTIQRWELDGESSESRNCPDYLLELMEYKLKKENLIK